MAVKGPFWLPEAQIDGPDQQVLVIGSAQVPGTSSSSVTPSHSPALGTGDLGTLLPSSGQMLLGHLVYVADG